MNVSVEKPSRRKFRQETVIHSYIFRPLALEIVRLVWNTNITPNQLTVFRIILNIVAVAFFAVGEQVYFVLGFMLFQLHEIIDHADGMYARLKGMTSKVGLFMEHFFDTAFSSSHNLLGLVLAYSYYSISGSMICLYLYISMAIGANLGAYYKKQFGLKEDESTDSGQEYMRVSGIPFKSALKNIVITIFIWQNQILLWSALLYFTTINTIGVDLFLLGFAACAMLNQLPWIYWSLNGLLTAIRADRDAKG